MTHLSVQLLGPFRVLLDGKTTAGFSTDKVRALLAYLVVEADRPHRREALAGLLWPDSPERSARTSLRSALANLRRAIADGDAEPPFLHITRQTIQFNSHSDAWVDVSKVSQLLQAEPSSGKPIHQLEEAIALYRGSFLEGFSLPDSTAFGDWVLIKREWFERQILAALHTLAGHHEDGGDYEKALPFARRQVEIDPWREPAQQQLMRLLALSDQRAAALAQYETCRQLLIEDLGVEPDKETRQLYERIRDERLPSPEPGDPLSGISRRPSFLIETPAVETTTPVFVGRESELGLLNQQLDRVLAERGGVIMIAGGAGRGKTALMEAFGRQAEQAHNVIVVSGYCNAYSGVGDPFLPFRQILDMLTGNVETLWAAGRISRERAMRLWQALPHTAQAIVEQGTDLIGTIVAGPPLVERVKMAVPRETKLLARLERLVEVRAAVPDPLDLEGIGLHEQFTRVLDGVSRHFPLLILLDDLQWVDQGSVDLLFHLGRHLLDSRILLVGAYRPDEVALGPNGKRHPLGDVVEELQRSHGDILLDLGRDDPIAGRKFVESLIDNEPNRLSAEFRQALYRRTGGHPLFTIDLLHMLQERGDLLRDEEGRWIEGPMLAWDALPVRVEAMIEQRIGRIEADLREMLAVASIEGEEFTAQVVARIQDIPERQLLGRFSKDLEKRHRLVRELGEYQAGRNHLALFRFSHNLYQHYLYQELSAGERRLLHGEVAQTLEEFFVDDIEAATVRLAFHYKEARLIDKAIHYLMQAGHQARARYANQEAVRAYSEALSLLPENHPGRFDLLAARVAVFDLMAARDAQRADIEAMLALADILANQELRCDRLIALTDYLLGTEPLLARDPALKAREIARELKDPVREAHVLRRLAWGLRLGADFQTNRLYIEEAAARYTEAGLSAEAANCWLMLTRRLPGSGEHAAELEAAEKALALSRQAGDLRQEAIALRHLAIAKLNVRQLDEALPLAEEALALYHELGDRAEECQALDVLGVIQAWLGQPKKAEAYFRLCLSLSDKIGSDWGVLGSTFGLWNYWYIPQGEYEQLLAFCDRRLKAAHAAEKVWLPGFLSWVKLDTLLALGQFNVARRLPETQGEAEAMVGDQVSLTFVMCNQGRLQAELGDYSDARQYLEAVLIHAEKIGDPYLASWPLIYLAKMALLADDEGEWRHGLDMAKRVVEISRDFLEVRQLSEGLSISARLHLKLGEVKEALACSEEVIHLLETTPALPHPQEYLYTHFLALRVLGRDGEAKEYLRRAHERVMLVAEKTTDESLRQSWLEDVRVNRQILRDWHLLPVNKNLSS